MRVAIIGGTGFVGSYIVDRLIASGHVVSMLVRPGSEYKVRHPDAIRTVTGQIDSPSSVAELLDGCDAVIYCVGILREDPGTGVTFESTQYDGVARTVAIALDKGVRRLLLMSANGVKMPGTPYQETKKRAEDLVLDSGLEATIFRPSVIFGDPRGQMEIATQLFREMVLPPIPAVGFYSGLRPSTGAVLMSPVHVEDVATAFVNALGEPATFGQIYELGGPDTLSWPEMIRRIAAATGRRKLIIPMPIVLMKLAATLFGWLSFFPVTRDQLTMLAEGNIAAASTIEGLTGAPPAQFSQEQLDYLNRT